MKTLEVNDYPPANAINQKLNSFPFIRCEDCHELMTLKLILDKREIQLNCENEQKTRNIPFNEFFATIDKYSNINFCQFCQNKKAYKNYYLCKTCSNKILCEDCYREHCKTDDIIYFKIDSMCKKHYFPYESFCLLCKENKCLYCSKEHDESHEKEEISFKKKILKENEINDIKNSIHKINSEKDRIELIINSVIEELKKKIEFINNLKNQFF